MLHQAYDLEGRVQACREAGGARGDVIGDDSDRVVSPNFLAPSWLMISAFCIICRLEFLHRRHKIFCILPQLLAHFFLILQGSKESGAGA